MDTADDWNEILASVERDLEQGGEERNSPAWSVIAERVRRLASILLSQHDVWTIDPEDLTQDVLLRLYSSSSLRRLRATGSPEGYLVVVIRHRIFDEVRRNRFRWRGSESPVDWNEISFGSSVAEIPIEHRIALEQVLDDLSDDDWELIRLRFWEDRSIKLIANHLGVTYSAASVRLFRLLRKLRHRLES